MPTVPTLDGSSLVTPSQAPDTQATTAVTAGLLNQGNQQVGQLGDALGTASNADAQIAINAQDLANQTVVNDAVNKLKTQQQALMYDPQNGVVAQTGVKAIQRDSGMSLADEYGQKLSAGAAQISSGLTNPAQQRMFQQQASDIATQFNGATTQWEGQQFKAYALSTQDGTVKLATNQVALNYNNPDQIDAGLQAIKAAVYQAGTINGSAATEIEAQQKSLTSNAVTTAIDTALQKGQITYANGLATKYAPDMTADDILKVNGKMSTYLGTQAASNVVARVFAAAGPQLSNSSFSRMVAITQQSESGGHETNPDGTTVTSPAGAQGIMQLMPATAANPGFGITPAQNDSPAERVRVATQYLNVLVTKYQDPAKAWAAYNAGPGAVDAAIQTATAAGTPGTWLTNLPQETQAYVAKNVQQLNSGAATPSRPSKLDIISQVRADPVLMQKPEWMTQAVTLAGQQYDEQTAAIAQQDTANLANVYRTLAANRGNLNSVSPDMLSKLNPSDYKEVMSFSESMAKGTNVTNTALYQSLITTPSIMANMSDDQWQTQASNLSQDDFKALSKIRADQINNTGTNSPGSINLRAMNETLSQRLQTIGINPYPSSKTDGSDAVSRVGAIRQFVTNSLLDAQQQAGKKFTEGDIESNIDGLFTKSVTLPTNSGVTNLWGLIHSTPTTQNLMGMTADQIPDDIATSLKADFKAHGVPSPNSGQLLGAYWSLQAASRKLQN